jgi:phytoene synthase
MLIDNLPPPQRLALAYAPRSSKNQLAALLAFDARLGQAVGQANEPIMGQMRLAWWRDQLAREPVFRESSDEVVVAIELLEDLGSELVRLVDGWEGLLCEKLDRDAVNGLVQGRVNIIQALAARLGERIDGLGQAWAFADLASGMSNPDERAFVVGLAEVRRASPTRIPRTLRPIAVLDRLGRRSLERGGEPLLGGPASLLLAMRLGLLGR